MTMEFIVGAVIAGLVVMFFVGKYFSKKLPKETHFECARCGTVARHTDRTIDAWRNNKTTFFCQFCHIKWVRARAPRERARSASPAGSRSGCLGVVVLFAVVPLAGFRLMHAYACPIFGVVRLVKYPSFPASFHDVAAQYVWKPADDCFAASTIGIDGRLSACCVENVEREEFPEVLDIQSASDRSLATLLASPGWQDFYLKVKVPEFFHTIRR